MCWSGYMSHVFLVWTSWNKQRLPEASRRTEVSLSGVSLGVCTIRQSNVTSHLQVVRLSLWSLQKFLPGWSSRHRGPPAAPLCKHSPSLSHLPSLSSTGLDSGATCPRGGRTPTVPEEGGCVGGQDGCCRGTEGLRSMTGAGRSGRAELACCLAVAGAPSLFGC